MTLSTVKPLKAAKEYSADEFPQYPTAAAAAAAADTQFWTENAHEEREIHYATRGYASQAETPAITVCTALTLAASKHPNQPALVQEDPRRVAVNLDSVPPALALSECKTWTWSTYHADVRKCAKAMRSVGFVQFNTCSIFGFNSPEWAISSIAGMFAGGKSSGIYPTDTAEQFQYKVLHSNTSVIFIETLKHLDLVSSVIDHLPYVKAVVVWGEIPQVSTVGHCTVWHWDVFLAESAKVTDEELDLIVTQVKPGHCSTLVYTSGTTGQPKAVMIAHDSETFVARTSVVHGVGCIALEADMQERVLSYLPLSHIAGKMIDIIVPLIVTAVLPGYATTYFARQYDLKLGTLVERVKWTRPTVFLGVPRVWEKIAEKMKQVGAKTKGVKRRIATWAKTKGLAYQKNLQLGGSGKRPFMYGLADKLVLGKVKLALGLDQVKFAFAGAAPMTLDTLRFFGNLGINVNEVYGMSESTGVITWSNDACHIWGTVGFTLPGMEVRILRPSGGGECPLAKTLTQIPDECQGEICYRGRHVMMGYLANPLLGEEHVEEIRKKNKEAIDSQGWLHSGDMGVKTDTGIIKITGRYKELIIGAGGENIAPVPIEDEIKRLGAGMISNVQMIGDKRKYNVALLTLMCKGATGEKPGSNELEDVIKQKFSSVNTIDEACKSAEFIAFVESIVSATNANGSVCPSNASVIGKFTILPKDYSVETGELTATLKLKRSLVEQKYASVLEAMYEDTSKAMFFNHQM